MKLEQLHLLLDRRINSLSVSAIVTIGEYLNWFDTYGEGNKLNVQRPQLNTRSANMIRRRLVEDLKQGAIIPPIVIGMTTEVDLSTVNEDIVRELILQSLPDATVIDGMQRSGALREAVVQNPQIASDPLRVEIWIANGTAELVYRMLVLNTGQTPWDIKRQMEVIYKPLIEEARQRISDIVLNEKYDKHRRRAGGEYPASSIIELFIAFSSRKEIIKASDSVADEFTKLDITDMSGKKEFSDYYYRCLKMMVSFDIAVSRYHMDDNEPDGDQRFSNGMDLFTQMPAKVGFIAALAQHIVGRAGMPDRPFEDQERIVSETEASFNSFIQRINLFDNDQLGRFLSFDVLNEIVSSLPVKKIGNAQREFFRSAFTTLIDYNFNVDSLEVIWRSY